MNGHQRGYGGQQAYDSNLDEYIEGMEDEQFDEASAAYFANEEDHTYWDTWPRRSASHNARYIPQHCKVIVCEVLCLVWSVANAVVV